MKVVILNTSETKGGAAIAAKRLLYTLRKVNVDAKMIVKDKQTEDVNVLSVNSSFFKRKINYLRFVWERFIIFLQNGFCRENLFPVSIANTGTDISQLSEIKNADIIHIHWINQGFLSIRDVGKLIRTGKPIVWTMHDMWPCTGICHHARDCNHFTKECGQCFFLKSKKRRDLSNRIFIQKQDEIFSGGNIALVGCSKWVANQAKISGILKKNNVVSIPNPIDTGVFTIADKTEAREKLKLPQKKKLILFGAANVTDKRKGIYYLIDAIKIIKNSYNNMANEISLVLLGKTQTEIDTLFDIPVFPMGYMTSIEDIVNLYNAVDLFITPSLEENLPNTIMEAMSCGTPCVGFNVGGIPEMIDHKENGYIAEYKNTEDLAKGVSWILSQADYSLLAVNARKKVIATYEENLIAKQYIELYNNMLN